MRRRRRKKRRGRRRRIWLEIMVFIDFHATVEKRLKFVKKSSDYSREVLKFVKKGSDYSREVLKFVKKGSDYSREVLTFAKNSVHFTRCFEGGRPIMFLLRCVFEGGFQKGCKLQ